MTSDAEPITCRSGGNSGWFRPLLSSLGFFLGLLFWLASIWVPVLNSPYPTNPTDLLEVYVWPSFYLIAMVVSFGSGFRKVTKGKPPHHGGIWLTIRAMLVGIGVQLVLVVAGIALLALTTVVIGTAGVGLVCLLLSITAAWQAGRFVGRSAIADGPDVPRCPACGYVLYHARDSRCPECGRRFQLGEIDLRNSIVSGDGVLQPRQTTEG